jgi:uncharacterized membrane protein
VYYEKLIPLLIEGIKEQQKQIEEIKNKLSWKQSQHTLLLYPIAKLFNNKQR